MRTKQQIGKTARRKGTNYERKVARDLSKYTGKNWRRVPYSGASYIPGDICCLDSPYPLVVELKNRADVKLDKVFKNPNCIQSYVSEHQILIFNNNGQDIVVHSLHNMPMPLPDRYATVTIAGRVYILLDLKDFANIIKENE